MMGLLRRGTPVLLSRSDNPKRKLAHTLEAVWVGSAGGNRQGFWCGVNTLTPNRLLNAAFEADILPFARRVDGYESFTAEMKYQNSRFDGFICGDGRPDIWVECKNVTLCEDDMALFPDAVTERGQKHLRELIALVQSGARAVMFYVIERPDCQCFAPADMIDLEYAKLFYQARDAGVEICPVIVRVDERGIFWDRVVPVSCLALSSSL
jgi:sugar fermentation stimulation protein A